MEYESRRSVTETQAGELSTRPWVELFHSTGSTDEQPRLANRLQDAVERGTVRTFDMFRCGDCASGPTGRPQRSVQALLQRRYRAFQRWADEHNRELVGFEREQVSSMLTGEPGERIVFPDSTLAEYRNGKLTFVAPSRGESGLTTPLDRVRTY